MTSALRSRETDEQVPENQDSERGTNTPFIDDRGVKGPNTPVISDGKWIVLDSIPPEQE